MPGDTPICLSNIDKDQIDVGITGHSFQNSINKPILSQDLGSIRLSTTASNLLDIRDNSNRQQFQSKAALRILSRHREDVLNNKQVNKIISKFKQTEFEDSLNTPVVDRETESFHFQD